MVQERSQVEVDRRVTDAFVSMPHATLTLPKRRTNFVGGCSRDAPRDVAESAANRGDDERGHASDVHRHQVQREVERRAILRRDVRRVFGLTLGGTLFLRSATARRAVSKASRRSKISNV
jgi:hypothetical protein